MRLQHRYRWRGRRFSVRRLLRVGEVVGAVLSAYEEKWFYSIGRAIGGAVDPQEARHGND